MRRVRTWVPLLLVAGAVAEVVVFVLVVRWLGAPVAVLLALATSVIGIVLLRREGIRAWRRFRTAVEAGEPPGVRVADGLVGLVGALMLALPGFVSDVVGLLLVLPPSRGLARRAVQRVAETRMSSGLAGDVFGPRRVRVRRGPPLGTDPPVPGRPGPDGGPDGGPGGGPDRPPQPIAGADDEGEIVDPDDRP
jgi:UPF0716 protein FxsA